MIAAGTITKTESSRPNLVTPRSRDYDKRRDSYFQSKQPPTVYNLRKPTLVSMARTPSNLKDQRMTDILANTPDQTIIKNQGINKEEKVVGNDWIQKTPKNIQQKEKSLNLDMEQFLWMEEMGLLLLQDQ